MSIKDFKAAGNGEGESKKDEARIQEEIKGLKKDEINGGQTEVKNAHATGDGSFGRNESRLPDEAEKKEPGDTAY